MWPISVLHSFSTYIHGHSLSSMCVYIYACMELYVANFNVHNWCIQTFCLDWASWTLPNTNPLLIGPGRLWTWQADNHTSVLLRNTPDNNEFSCAIMNILIPVPGARWRTDKVPVQWCHLQRWQVAGSNKNDRTFFRLVSISYYIWYRVEFLSSQEIGSQCNVPGSSSHVNLIGH